MALSRLSPLSSETMEALALVCALRETLALMRALSRALIPLRHRPAKAFKFAIERLISNGSQAGPKPPPSFARLHRELASPARTWSSDRGLGVRTLPAGGTLSNASEPLP